jgi:hypothetical protein
MSNNGVWTWFWIGFLLAGGRITGTDMLTGLATIVFVVLGWLFWPKPRVRLTDVQVAILAHNKRLARHHAAGIDHRVDTARVARDMAAGNFTRHSA